ncbi:MAG: hypothetical protein IKZ07_02520 [Akkermansia sp.]|nr:hypothetical protein [Akkermansia sp.]
MRFALAIATVAALCPIAVQGAEPQNAMPPALLEAIAGNEPYCSLVEYGLPLINTTAEVESLPVELRLSRAAAIKRVLLGQMVRAKAERHRVSPENYALSAQRAVELGTPMVFALYMQLEAQGELSSRARYTVREALRQLYSDYRVHELDLRLFVETSHLAPEDILDAAGWLPMEVLFSPVYERDFTAEGLERQYKELGGLVSELAAVYTSVQSAEQAQSAADKLLPLLVRYAATQGTRKLATAEQLQGWRARYGLLYRDLPHLNEQRRRVQQANYFDCVKLRIIDYFLN